MGQHAGAEMRPRGMPRKIQPGRIAAEACGVPVDPEDGAAHLIEHGRKIAAGLADVDEIGDDVVGAGAHERLGLHRVVGGLVAQPGAAVQEDVDRRVRLGSAEDVEPFDLASAVGNALGRAESGARTRTVGDPALDDPRPVGRVFLLVISVVERLLVHVEPDQRGHLRSLVQLRHPKFNSLKKSLPLSSMTMKAGKFSTSMRQIASMPSSGYSTTSTFLMQCSARFAAAPPIEAR